MSPTGQGHDREDAAVTRRPVSSVALGLLASLVLVTNAAAAPPTWTALQTIRSATDIRLGDADFAGHNVAIAWDEPDHPRRVDFAFSGNNGANFASPPPYGASRQPAIELCDGSQPNAVYAHRQAPGNWIIQYTLFDSFDFALTTDVAPSSGVQHDPDIACTDGRVFVSWFKQEGSGDRLFVAHATRDLGTFSSPIDLGFDSETEFFSGLVLAGVGDTAYAAFRRSSGDLRFRSWSIGAGPAFPVTANPAMIIGPGTPNNPAFQPVIAAAGNKVAVAWMTCDAVVARVSNDKGVTWGPIRTLVEHAACDGDFIAAPNSIAIRGGRIALEYTAAGIIGDGDENPHPYHEQFRVVFGRPDLSHGRFSDVVGYLTVGGHVKLAEAFQGNDRIRFRRQI